MNKTLSTRRSSASEKSDNLQCLNCPSKVGDDDFSFVGSWSKTTCTRGERSNVNRRCILTCDSTIETEQDKQIFAMKDCTSPSEAAFQSEENAFSASCYQNCYVPSMTSRACTMDNDDLIRLLNQPVYQEDIPKPHSHGEQQRFLGRQQQHQKHQQHYHHHKEHPQEQQQQIRGHVGEVVPAPPILASCESTSSIFEFESQREENAVSEGQGFPTASLSSWETPNTHAMFYPVEAYDTPLPSAPLTSIVRDFFYHDEQSDEFVSRQRFQSKPKPYANRLGVFGLDLVGPDPSEERQEHYQHQKLQFPLTELFEQQRTHGLQQQQILQKLTQECYSTKSFVSEDTYVPVPELLNDCSSKSDSSGGSDTNERTASCSRNMITRDDSGTKQGTKRLHECRQENDFLHSNSKRPRYTPQTAIRYFEVTDRDVLFGRGPSVYSHPGNVALHDEKLKVQPLYLKMGKAEKKKISQQLVDRIHELGGRFLQQEPGDGLWYEVTNRQAREKAAQVLREVFTPEMRREKRQRYKYSANDNKSK